MKTLTIELRRPFTVRVIDGNVYSNAQMRLAMIEQSITYAEDPPPLLVAACAAKARAESARRGWQTRKTRPTATGVASAVAREITGGDI